MRFCFKVSKLKVLHAFHTQWGQVWGAWLDLMGKGLQVVADRSCILGGSADA